MEIKIEGNSGTGNTFMEINIQHVENFHASAFNNKGTHAKHQDVDLGTQDAVDAEMIRTDILTYANRLRICLADEWKSNYLRIWEDILDIKSISASVYNPGKQQGTNFNRSLVANIIHYLYGRGFYKGDFNAAQFTDYLEGNKDHSVRSALGKDPSSDIVSSLDRYFG